MILSYLLTERSLTLMFDLILYDDGDSVFGFFGVFYIIIPNFINNIFNVPDTLC